MHNPTGTGKTLVWLLAALTLPKMGKKGVTIVVLPLVALLRDQFHRMYHSRLDSNTFVAIDQDTPVSERESLYRRLHEQDPNLKFIFLSNAMLVGNRRLFDLLTRTIILMMVFDEYHTLLDWFDFYTAMSQVLNATKMLICDDRTTIAFLSATATNRHIEKISDALEIKSRGVISPPPFRPAIHLGVVLSKAASRMSIARHIRRWMNEHPDKDGDKTPIFVFVPFAKVRTASNVCV